MNLLFVTFLAMFLFAPANALPQINCFAYAGGMTSCSGPRSNTLITPLSPNQGIIQGDRDGHSFIEPYTIFPPSSSSRDTLSSPRDGRPIEPLNRLDRLNRLDSFEDRRSRDRDPLNDPLNDPLLPLLLGE